MRLKSLLVFLFISSVIPTALAQLDIQDLLINLLLGELPGACRYRTTSPQCFECIIYTKLIPILAIVAILYLLLNYVFMQMGPAPPTDIRRMLFETRETGLRRFEVKVLLLLCVIFSIIIIHAVGPELLLTYLGWMINILLFLGAIMAGTAVARSVTGKFGWIVGFFVFIILLGLLYGTIGGSIVGIVNEWKRMCI